MKTSDSESQDTIAYLTLQDAIKKKEMEEQQRRRDTILRKKPKMQIRRESFNDPSPTKRATVLERMSTNE